MHNLLMMLKQLISSGFILRCIIMLVDMLQSLHSQLMLTCCSVFHQLCVDVSHKEPIIPNTQNKGIAAVTDESASPSNFFDFFANSATQSSGPFIDPSHTLNMPNYEPHHRPFFRNLAQNVFPHKDKDQDLAEIKEGAYPLAQLEHDTTNIKNIWLLRMMFIWSQTQYLLRPISIRVFHLSENCNRCGKQVTHHGGSGDGDVECFTNHC
jgi:hypothetical protein